MFTSIKMEEYMEPELSGFFCVKMVAKNIVLESPETHFMHMRVKNLWKHLYILQYSRLLLEIKTTDFNVRP